MYMTLTKAAQTSDTPPPGVKYVRCFHVSEICVLLMIYDRCPGMSYMFFKPANFEWVARLA